MQRTLKFLVAGVLAATGLTLTGNIAKAQPPGYRPYPPNAGPIRIQPQYPPPYPYPGPVVRPVPLPYPVPAPYPYPAPPVCDFDYVVYVKCPIHRDWKFYGKYETFGQARQVECALERQGQIARIDKVPCGRRW